MELKTTVFYKAGGTTYTFPFEYLQKNFVKVRYQKPDASYVNLEYEKDYIIDETTVTLMVAGSTDDIINIYRETPTDRLVKYVDASILKAHDMNVDELQTLHIMEEQTDYLTSYALFKANNANRWDARQLRMVNLALPQEPTDAANKAYVDEYDVKWDQNVAQMKKQLQDQDNNIAAQLDAQNSKITKQLQDQQTNFNNQLNEQDASFNDRISAHDTELLNKVDKNNQQYKADLQTYNNNLAKQISDDATAKLNQSEKWAQASVSPDNASDTSSPMGKTQSSKSWALYSKERAVASAASASAAKTSEGNAANSASTATAQANAAKEQATASANSANASAKSATASKASEDKAKTSEVNAKASEVAAAESAKQATAGQINADWNETNADSRAYIKNKPDVPTKADIANSVTTKALTVSGETSVPTANEGNSSNTIASTEFVAKSLAKMVDSAPESLNTLNELAKALGNDPNFSATVLNELGKKMNSAEAESTFAKKEDAGVLSGTVMAFSGTFENGYPINKRTGLADKKWYLCDGTNGTPDLRQRFILGGDGTDNGTTGGEASVTLTQQNIPKHSHTASCSTSGKHYHGAPWEKSDAAPDVPFGWYSKNNNHPGMRGVNSDKDNALVKTSTEGDHTHTISIGNTGGGQPHNNMPPHYVLAYIMKL